MGDTGSLAIGGAIAALAVMTNTEILLIVIGGIFVMEALSVLIQVFTFRFWRKRVFKMAPIHHHFELEAWSETKIMLRFWIVAAACGAIGFTLYQISEPPKARERCAARGGRAADPLARDSQDGEYTQSLRGRHPHLNTTPQRPAAVLSASRPMPNSRGLSGTAPIAASSGITIRYRLNRACQRQAGARLS